MSEEAPFKTNSLMGSHAGVDKEPLDQSMSLLDINEDPPLSNESDKNYSENSQIFEEIVEDTEAESQVMDRFSTLRRQSSLVVEETRGRLNAETTKPSTKSFKMSRRHSSFTSRDYKTMYKQHKEMKRYLESLESTSRTTEIAKKLLEFNMSINLASCSDLSLHDESLSMHYSCPVLSYMNDEEEDSVDLAAQKRVGSKRTLAPVGEESELSWESMNDDVLDDPFQSSAEYHVEMKKDDHEDRKPRSNKRRRPRSCIALSQQLMKDDPQKVLRSFMAAR